MPKKRKDGRYAKQVTIGIKDGKTVRKTLYGNTIKELDQNYRDFMQLKDKGIVLTDQNMRYRDLHRLWINNVKEGTIKQQTLDRYFGREKFINSYIGDLKPIDIKKSHIEKIRSDLIKEKMITKFNFALGDIRAVLQYGISIDILARDVTTGIKRISYEPAPKRALNSLERSLLERANFTPTEKCFVWLLLYTGMRRNEALAIMVDDINFKKATLKVCKTLIPTNRSNQVSQEMTKTSAGNRILPITAPLMTILKEFCADKTGVVLATPTGRYYRTNVFQRFWKGILSKMSEANNGVPVSSDITPHIFRHTYASDLYKAGIDIKQAQYLLGHTDIATTLDVYTHFGFADVQISKMEDYYDTVKMQSENKIISIKQA